MSLVDPMISLAFSMHEAKGIHALLLGSGVSRAAGIPTGWEVVLDLIRKVAHLQSENCEPDPAQWYCTKFGTPPDYARMLEMLGASQAERSALLRTYFEPNEEEREQGLKVPTGAHRSIAELVVKGYVRVIITTNFDRLLEQAVESAGVIPTVISTPDGAKGAVPLTHARCTIIKVHGDYLDARVKNTTKELEEYDERVDALLDRVFEDFAIVICGWSAEWDTALRGALERCESRRFTTYWASRGHDTEAAERLMAVRRAHRIQIRDADAFFCDLSGKVIALDEYTQPHPLSTKAAIARAKRYLADERHHILLHELVDDETERVYDVLSEANFAAKGVSFNAEELRRRLTSYEASLKTLVPLLATGCYWGVAAHERVWVKALERIGNPQGGRDGTVGWLSLRLYPALLLLYACGTAAVAQDKYGALSALLTRPKYYEEGRGTPLACNLIPNRVVDLTTFNQMLERPRLTPVSDHLAHVLRSPLQELLRDDAAYERTFDRFECLYALIYEDELRSNATGMKGLVGRFGYKLAHYGASSPLMVLLAEAADKNEAWEPLRAGLFGGDYSRFEQAAESYTAWVSRVVQQWG